LPPQVELQGENLYEVAQPIEAKAGIADWWQGGGGGVQYEIPASVRSLLENGLLKRYQP
jgi:Tuberculosis necrotizing toxin